MLVQIYERLIYHDVRYILLVSHVLCAYERFIGLELVRFIIEILKKKQMEFDLMMVIFIKN
jgi:hypothetical protein